MLMIRFPKFFLPLLGAGSIIYFTLLFAANHYRWEIGRLDVLVELFTLPFMAAVPGLLILGIIAVIREKDQRTTSNFVGIALLLINVVLLGYFTYLS
jgi:hypothetical protein